MQTKERRTPARRTSTSKRRRKNALEGKTVIVTRPRDQASELVKLLEDAGATVVLFPMIEITEPVSWARCDDCLRNLSSYDCLIFTSSNAVKQFFFRAKSTFQTSSEQLTKKRIFVVGGGTAKTVERYGLMPESYPEVKDSGDLADALKAEFVTGKKFLFPRGDIAQGALADSLRKKGAVVDEVVVYRTGQPSSADAVHIQRAFSSGDLTILTFFSPSSVKNFVDIVGADMMRESRVAVIGQTTADAAKDSGLSVDMIAEWPSPEGLVSSIVRYFEQR